MMPLGYHAYRHCAISSITPLPTRRADGRERGAAGRQMMVSPGVSPMPLSQRDAIAPHIAKDTLIIARAEEEGRILPGAARPIYFDARWALHRRHFRFIGRWKRRCWPRELVATSPPMTILFRAIFDIFGHVTAMQLPRRAAISRGLPLRFRRPRWRMRSFAAVGTSRQQGRRR